MSDRLDSYRLIHSSINEDVVRKRMSGLLFWLSEDRYFWKVMIFGYIFFNVFALPIFLPVF